MSNTLKVNDKKNISWFVKLFIISLVVLGTWNPSEYNSINYIRNMDFSNVFNYFAILVLLTIWGIFIRIVYEAMGKLGATIFLFLAFIFIMGMYQQGWINFSNLNTSGLILNITFILLIFIATMIPIWWRKITGKVATDSDME